MFCVNLCCCIVFGLNCGKYNGVLLLMGFVLSNVAFGCMYNILFLFGCVYDVIVVLNRYMCDVDLFLCVSSVVGRLLWLFLNVIDFGMVNFLFNVLIVDFVFGLMVDVWIVWIDGVWCFLCFGCVGVVCGDVWVLLVCMRMMKMCFGVMFWC